MNEHLLTYYTALTQHHRHKLTFLIGTAIGLTQIIAFTPDSRIESVAELDLSFGDSLMTFLISIFLIMVLLLTAIGHHACNLVSAATNRIRHESYALKVHFKCQRALKIHQ